MTSAVRLVNGGTLYFWRGTGRSYPRWLVQVEVEALDRPPVVAHPAACPLPRLLADFHTSSTKHTASLHGTSL